MELFDEFAPRSILIVDSPYTKFLKESTYHSREMIQPTIVPSLESHVLSHFSLCVVSNQQELMSEEIQKNILTPVLFIASPPEIEALINKSPTETFEDAVNRTLEKYNLFDIADIEKRFETIKKAFAEKQMLSSYLRKLPLEMCKNLLQKTYDPPRFRTFFRDVMTVYDDLEQKKMILSDGKQEVAFNALLMQKMREWHFCRPGAKFEKSVEKEALDLALEYLKQRESGVRKTPLLGHGAYSEESVDRLSTSLSYTFNPTPDEFRWRVARLIVDDSQGNDHKKIANQRYIDAQVLQDSEFLTSLIYKPLHLDSSGMKASFVLMQDIEGPTLDQVLGKITDEIDRGNRRDPEKTKKLKKLRNDLVNKFVKDIIFWQTHKNLNTFTKKPAPLKILDDYYGRISDIPKIFSKLAPGLFSEEECTAYADSLKCIYSISISSEDVVRIRDATLKNVVLSLDGLRYDAQKQEHIFSIDDLLRNMASLPKCSSAHRIDKIFYHVDLHYRYGHVLEDLSHIITAQESAFLIQSEHKENEDHFVTEKQISSILAKFLNGIERPDIHGDKQSIYLMFFYRSARKLELYSERYIRNSFKEFSRGEITEEILKERLKTKKETMWHHARSCLTILGHLRRYIKNNTVRVDERLERVEAIYDEALKNGYTGETAKLFFSDNLKDITDSNVLLYAQLSALSLTFRKLTSYLRYNTLHFENVMNNGN